MGWTVADTERWAAIPVTPEELEVLAHGPLPEEDATIFVGNVSGYDGAMFRWEPDPRTPVLGPAFFVLDPENAGEDLAKLRGAAWQARGREQRILRRVADQLAAWMILASD